MAAYVMEAALFAILTLLIFANVGECQVLTPPYFDLAVGRSIASSSTCGETLDEPELFCKLTGASLDKDDERGYEVIQGQLCDVCDPSQPDKAHPARQAVDGTERWWQSPPLSRGLHFNEVNLTIDLGQEFHVAYVFIKMGNSPRPGVFALERSTDGGHTWKPWQFFADTLSDCNNFFGHYKYTDRIISDDSVVCTTRYSKVVPLEGGEIVVSLVNNRPSAHNFSYATTLQEWTRATNIRLRLIRTKTLLGHLMAVARQDPTVTRRYFYSIKDISIGGRCVCNGHANVCDRTDPNDQTQLLCRCQHNTCGAQCETCCPGYIQKPWRPATLDNANECEPCQCHGHSRDCYHDEEVAKNRESIDVHGRFEGGGVCQNCRHNTEGINCEKCRTGYYRPYGVPLNSTNVCQRCTCDLTFSTGDCEDGTGRCFCRPEYAGEHCERCNLGYYDYPHCKPCDCNINGTQNGVCEVGGGQCPCKPNYDGPVCDRCAYGYYGFSECRHCGCNRIGALGSDCSPDAGVCQCRDNYGGRDCSQCGAGYYSYPSCQLCSCDLTGATEEVCDKDIGRCICQDNFGGARCERCALGFYGYPHCRECGCNSQGAQGTDCDSTGQCVCKYNYAGRTCDRCAAGYYQYPECLPCNCDNYGSYGISCEQNSGQCDCRATFEGITCNKCRPTFFNYPNCEECNCNPAGAKDVPGHPLGGCGEVVPGKLCECKRRVGGRTCDECKAGFWNLNINTPGGCEDCNCNRDGTIGGSNVCDIRVGQCICKANVEGRTCDTCVAGTFNLQADNLFGCADCGCDAGGSLNHICDKRTGDCQCRPRVNGQRCDQPLTNHFFPTLYQHQYEMEGGRTVSGGAVRYGFDGSIFPGYSWRGYAIYSRIQDEILVDVDIKRPSLYRLIFRYVNRNDGSVTADVKVTPEATTDVQQTSTVMFDPTYEPKFVTVSGSGVTIPFVLNPGRWTISLKTSESLFVDYLVLLPQDFYEASILQERVNKICTVPATNDLCKHYVYVDVYHYTVAKTDDSYVRINNERQRPQTFPNEKILEELGSSNMAVLNKRQTELLIDIQLPSPGKYVFILQYHTRDAGRKQEINVEVASAGGRQNGIVILPGCPYSSLCRQVVTDRQGNVLVFDIDGNYASMTLTGKRDIDLAVDTVIAVPYGDWSLEHIQPRLKCIRRNKQCIESSFLTPTGTGKAEVETGPNEDRVATDVPPSIIGVNVKVVKLDGRAPTVNVKASVQSPGSYAVIIHYYQPYHVGFDIYVNVTVGGKVYKGKFHAKYCPGVSGCRAAIDFGDVTGQILDIADQDIVLSFKSDTDRPIWLDYAMIVPASHFRPEVLVTQPIDKAEEFIRLCGKDDFYVDPNLEGFCRDSVFSLTTDYNNGAVGCDCNSEGSLNFQCEEFGGQCQCKPNVIGRVCSQCRTGYYGFPNCRTCNCPSGLCDPVSGQCVCPPRVTGPDCNVCLPRTFGFDRLIGCEECNCDPSGVRNNDLDCEVNTGMCSCKPNIAGRNCDRCVAGFYGFPRCQECSCDTRGTTADICDQRTSKCLCKENVEGPQCSQCNQGSYYLEDRNRKGCTRCFCFGTTTRCESSSYRRKQIQDMNGWGITNLRYPNVQQRDSMIEVKVKQETLLEEDQPLYWVAPEPYLGNKVTSYGGKLLYTVKFRPASGANGLVTSDVRIEGNNYTIVHIASQQPPPVTALNVEVDLLEVSFMHEASEAPVTREQFMMALSRIRSLQIRASYYSQVLKVSLKNVQMDVAGFDGTGALARNVEQCRCPENYMGSSCELCAPGYYRSKTGPYLGVCIPCECHGRANTCDPDSGECIGCRNNFGGPQCLTCKPGHYHDPYSGSCQICSCPLPVESNNFASTCEVLDGGVVVRCECLPGYTGPQCDSCDLGYWGNPSEIGGSCKACDCSGNIDIRDPTSCDPYDGSCLKCIHNSMGDRCERCMDWYWGDAVDVKDCKPCRCNTVGSVACDRNTGSCLCKPNVVGPYCDKCAPGTFGFESGRGCQACDCGSASYGPQCDKQSGVCECRPGVSGRRCDQCDRGYWNYQDTGCQKCNCEFEGAVTCDPVSGTCQCLPGVTGAKCDQCLHRWVLVPDQGCQECDSCVHLLLDDVDVIQRDVMNMSRELDSVSVGVGAIRRLNRINESVYELRPKVDSIIKDPTDPTILDPFKDSLLEVQQMADDLRDKGDRAVRESELVESDAANVRREADKLAALVNMAADAADDAVGFVQGILQDILNNIQSEDVENLLKEAERILEEIKSKDFTDSAHEADDELYQAEETLDRVKQLKDRAMEQMNKTVEIKANIDMTKEKLMDLINQSRHSLDNSKAAQDLNAKNDRVVQEIKDLVKSVDGIVDNTNMMLDVAKDLLDQAREFLIDAETGYEGVKLMSSRLDPAMESLQTYINKISDDEDLRRLVDDAKDHAEKLRKQAELLANMIADTRESADAALRASRAYKAIVDGINDAMNSSTLAVEAAEKAGESSEDLAEMARKSRVRSEELRETAAETKDNVESLEPRLDNAKSGTDDLAAVNGAIKENLDIVNAGLDMLGNGDRANVAKEAADRAMRAQKKAEDAQNKIQGIIDRGEDDARKIASLPDDIAGAVKKISAANSQVRDVLDLIPTTTGLLDSLLQQADKVNKVGERLVQDVTDLRNKIRAARGEANRIEVGMSFHKNTSLQIRNPPNILEAGAFSSITLYFRTKQRNGFLAYVGPKGVDASLETQDYMALEIIDGKVVFKFDLGTGAAEIIADKQVDDGEWHKVVAERTVNTGRLTVSTDEEADSVAEGKSTGSKTVLNLKAGSSVFYIGGVPAHAGLSGRVQNQHFEGCLEGVKFGDTPVGLWDFVFGENNKKGCLARDVFISAGAKGFRFGGDGHITMSRGLFNPRRSRSVSLDFKTFATDGVIFLMGDATDFMAIEMRDGYVRYLYDLGSGPAILQSVEKYNDGKWHTLVAKSKGKDGMLKVDGRVVVTGLSPGSMSELSYTNEIYIGGYPGQHGYVDVVQALFDGCIRNVMFGTLGQKLYNNIFAQGIIPGCTEVARVVSFSEGSASSYIAIDPINIDANFEMTMKLKTLNQDGLIFYIHDGQANQENAFSLSVVDGKIVLIAVPDGKRTVLETDLDQYSDGAWHYVTITKDGRDLQLYVDDSQIVKTKSEGKKKISTTSKLYFGGVERGFSITEENVGTRSSFIGCLGDVTIMGGLVNFAEVRESDKSGAQLSACPIPDPTPAPTAPSVSVDSTRRTDDLEQCVLPIVPDDDSDSAIRFGSNPESRLEYDTFPGSVRIKSEFEVEFKTTAVDGLIFYAVNNRQVKFLALYLQNEKVVFAFNCGASTVTITSNARYNDGHWHTAVFSRNQRRGELVIDGTDASHGRAEGTEKTITVEFPYYVGGLPEDEFFDAHSNLGDIPNFIGCLKNFRMNSIPLGGADREFYTYPCSSKSEKGSFFYSEGGNIALHDQYNVGLDLTVTMQIKPRTLSGVILSVASMTPEKRMEYLVLQMEDGKMRFTAENGGSRITTVFEPPAKNELCNGMWHSVRAQKAKNVVTLTVDAVHSKPGSGEPGIAATDTDSPLYIGGVPDVLDDIHTSGTFVGCIKDVVVENNEHGIITGVAGGQASGKVSIDQCPTT